MLFKLKFYFCDNKLSLILILKKVLFPFVFLFIGWHIIYAQKKIIKTGDEWQYYDLSQAPSENWYKKTGSTNNWKMGISPLGYGNDSIRTTISFGDDATNKHIVKYFKKTFIIANPFAHLYYELTVQRDDGIVIYLNGFEIMRNNMPEGIIDNTTKANSLIYSDDMASQALEKIISPEDFKAGINTIAVSVHQARETSSDCFFNLELVGNDNTDMIPLLMKERTIKDLNLDIRIKELNHTRELEKSAQHIEFITNTNKNLIIGVYFISFLFLLSLSGIGYLLWYNRKKGKILHKKVNILREELQNKDRRLMSSSLNTVQNQQFLKELRRDLSDSISESELTAKKELKKTIRKIDYNLDQDEEWLSLLNHFNTVHVGFVEKLSKLHPSLTDTEQRHCIFIKLHMQTKEIAQILHIDPRSVQASRYRIKKKMGLAEGVDLRDYVLKL